ncbi:MAG: hypothetical protein V1659_03625 [Candidatus Woesearchaeota archaeon]
MKINMIIMAGVWLLSSTLAYMAPERIKEYMTARNAENAVTEFQNSINYLYVTEKHRIPHNMPIGVCIIREYSAMRLKGHETLEKTSVVTVEIETAQLQTGYPRAPRLCKVLVDIGSDGTLEGVIEGTTQKSGFPSVDEASAEYRPATKDEAIGYNALMNAGQVSRLLGVREHR